MGDRGNIIITSPPWYQDGEEVRPATAVVLYTHWGGSGLDELVARVLAKRDRWSDPAYLARIVFSAMTKGDENSTTGYGITAWPVINDNEHDLIVLDTETMRINAIPEPTFTTHEDAATRPAPRVPEGEGVSFEEVATSWEAVKT